MGYGEQYKYFRSRQSKNYFKKVIDIVSEIGGDSILDVGAGPAGMLNLIPYKRKVALDIEPILVEKQQDIEYIQSDFLEAKELGSFDVVICCQAIEHMADPKACAEKLMTLFDDTLIVSIPYHWKDPRHNLTTTDIEEWFPSSPTETIVIDEQDNRGRHYQRLICIWKKNGSNSDNEYERNGTSEDRGGDTELSGSRLSEVQTGDNLHPSEGSEAGPGLFDNLD